MDDVVCREDAMSQEDAMNMSDERALKILKPMRDMMRDQHGCPISDAYFALKKATDALAAQQWIPCSERLPDQNGKYLVVGRQKAINILKFDGGRWYGKWGVVAWMPLPSPYREETES